VNRRLKLVLLALAISVALNVFLLGFFAARVVRRSHDGRFFDESGEHSTVLRESWRKRAETLRGRREAVDLARRGVRAALLAEPFDAEALTTALAALRAETNQTQAALDQALVEFARGLSAEDRKKLAEARWFGSLGDRRGPRGR
jgi:uncharacterized membrane protein